MQNPDNYMTQIITDKELYLIGKIHAVVNKLKALEQQYSTVKELISSKNFSEEQATDKLAAK